ncbi:MAG: MFS transporter, partial [Suipraeoptans sp.]
AFAWTMYNMSQSLLVPLATRNTKQRDKIALFQNMGMNMVPGMLTALIFPMIALPWMGVSPERWALIMSIFSIIAIPGMLIQYFFTKERVTEDALQTKSVEPISLKKQVKTCFSDKYWLIFMGVIILYNFSQNMNTSALAYYANWVLGSYNDGITMTMLNAIGQMPLGLGVFLLWPLVKKIGKRKVMFGGMILAAVTFTPVIFMPTNFPVVMGAIFIKSFGILPTYLIAAFIAETLDHIDWKNGFRCDGFTATCTNIALTVMTGLSTGVFNLGLSVNGYMAPEAGTTVVQNASTQSFIVFAYAGIPCIAYVLIALLMHFFRVEDKMPQISADIIARHKREAEERGEVYISPEELATQEQEKQDAIAETKRLEELKARCNKKGLSFETEEAKYQAKLAERAAKEAKKKKGDK